MSSTFGHMGEAIDEQRQSAASAVNGEGATRVLVGVSATALAAQVALTDYGTGQQSAAAIWFVIGCVLRWLVYSRRSRAARGFVIVASLVGAILYGLDALNDTHSAFLAVAFLAQAVPLMTKPVRLHVQSGS